MTWAGNLIKYIQEICLPGIINTIANNNKTDLLTFVDCRLTPFFKELDYSNKIIGGISILQRDTTFDIDICP